jgi:glycosyltransferase involved in cell wall biosynthesis
MKEKTPLITVIIPLYNRQDLIKETIDTIIAQSYKYWECIIVDDHSTDRSLEVVQEYAARDTRIKVYKRPENIKKGANACRNYGFLKSSGAYIQWFDSDDLMEKGMLKKKLSKIEEGLDFVACKFKTFTQDITMLEAPDFSISKGLVPDFLCRDIPLNTPMILWRRDLIKDLRFDESLSRAQELDFISRILIHKKPSGVLVDDYLVYIREHENSITGNFNKGGKKETIDEVKVRFNIHNTFDAYKAATIHIYYKAIKNSLQRRYFMFSIIHLLKTLFVIDRKFVKTQFRLLFLALSFSLFGKGIEQYKTTIKKYE